MSDVDFEDRADDIMMDVDIWLASAGILSTLQMALSLALIRFGFWLFPTSLKNLLMADVDDVLDDMDVDEF